VILLEAVRAVLESWRLDPVVSVDRATSGTMNETFIVTTEQQRVVLRRHRRRDRQQVEHEHEVIAHARGHGIPVPAAIPTPRGDLTVDQDGAWYSLFTFAHGRQLDKDELTPARAWAMGATLARIHVALQDFPIVVSEQPAPTSDLQPVADTIRTLLERIDQRPVLVEQDLWARQHLESKARWLQTATAPVWRPVPADAVQMGHGDYQETNLFFIDDDVADVIDWDKAEACWPVDEVVRTLDLSLRLRPALCAAMVDGYRSVRGLSFDVLDHSAANYGHQRVHSHWLYEGIYERADDRLRTFLKPGPFVPIADQWKALRSRLA